ncbi:E3 12.5K [Titi monkey adenovirus ECC-2011]|uniref:E3 12.5K n=1 Tax=titi monkey adenovirus 1 TaxID=3123084 RepID=G0ZAJ1_9ADEN|nr:E3 12.5K [Titi monkey adenovirus ECC-2011]AEK98462.1 E3 12.5K [Titi monkey adenovirus ECC-2011]
MTDGDLEAEVEKARLRHLVHCRRPRCYARDLLLLEGFFYPPNHPEGPAHGLRLTVPETQRSRLDNFFTGRPLLVETTHGPVTLSVTCICAATQLHEELFERLCTIFNTSTCPQQ